METEELLLLNVEDSELEGPEVVVSATKLVADDMYEEEPVWVSDDELRLDDEVIWAKKLVVEGDD